MCGLRGVPFKCFLRPELQIATLVCDTDVFEMEMINTLNVRNIIAYDNMLRITVNVVSDISFSVVLDLNLFSLSILFPSCRKCLEGKRYILLFHPLVQ